MKEKQLAVLIKHIVLILQIPYLPLNDFII